MMIIATVLILQSGYILVEAPRAEHASQVRLLKVDAGQLEKRLMSRDVPVSTELGELRRIGLLNDPSPLRQFVQLDGTTLEASDDVGSSPVLAAGDIGRATLRGEVRMIAWQGHRAPAYIVRVPSSPPIVLIDMARSDRAAVIRHRILRRQLTLIPISVFLGGALAWLAISRQLRRLRSIVDFVIRTAAGESVAVTPTTDRDELAVISTSLNDIVMALRRALDYQQRFASQAAHELRAPLTVIRTEADLALASASVQELSDALSSIREETVKLTGLVSDLLELGVSSESNMKVERVEAEDLVESATCSLVSVAAERNVRLRVVADEGCVRVSRVAFEHAIHNLVDNAIRYASIDSTVYVECRRGNNEWKIVVENTGDGLDREGADRVFEAFVRDRNGGYGLGLAFVKLIAEAHGGKAGVASSEVGLTQFVITLPDGKPQRQEATL